jgi:hypothetical protein
MLLKSTMTALTALAVLGLAVTNASAKPGGPGIGKVQGVGMNPGIIKQAGGIKIIPSNPIKPGKPVHWPGLKPHWPHHHHHHHGHYRPRYWYPAPVAVAAPTYIASRPGPCTCLSKEYTQEGVVVFKDRCTNEMAMNPPPPQQTGAVEQQQQSAQYQQQYVQPQPQGMQQK